MSRGWDFKGYDSSSVTHTSNLNRIAKAGDLSPYLQTATCCIGGCPNCWRALRSDLTMEDMTSRQRWLAALHLQPVDRLLDGRTHCPDKCLIGGTNATLWTQSSEEIIAAIEKELDALSHHRGIVVTSAGVMPPLCKPETIREVSEWVKQYPARTLIKESPMTVRSPGQMKTSESSF